MMTMLERKSDTFRCEQCKLIVSSQKKAWYSVIDKSKPFRYCSHCYIYLQKNEIPPDNHEHNSQGPVFGYGTHIPVWICANCQAQFEETMKWISSSSR